MSKVAFWLNLPGGSSPATPSRGFWQRLLGRDSPRSAGWARDGERYRHRHNERQHHDVHGQRERKIRKWVARWRYVGLTCRQPFALQGGKVDPSAAKHKRSAVGSGVQRTKRCAAACSERSDRQQQDVTLSHGYEVETGIILSIRQSPGPRDWLVPYFASTRRFRDRSTTDCIL